MTTLLLVRHGQTAWNHELRYQGQIDTALNHLGRAQAVRLAERLRGENIAAVYSSDLARSAETARIVASPHGLTPVLLPELREADYGEWQGLSYAEVHARYPDLVQARRTDVAGFAPPQGESLGQTHERARAAIENVAARHPRETVLVVTHGGPLRMLIAGILGMPANRAFALRLDNCGLTICESFPKSPTIATLNETCHLRGLAVPADPALGN